MDGPDSRMVPIRDKSAAGTDTDLYYGLCMVRAHSASTAHLPRLHVGRQGCGLHVAAYTIPEKGQIIAKTTRPLLRQWESRKHGALYDMTPEVWSDANISPLRRGGPGLLLATLLLLAVSCRMLAITSALLFSVKSDITEHTPSTLQNHPAFLPQPALTPIDPN